MKKLAWVLLLIGGINGFLPSAGAQGHSHHSLRSLNSPAATKLRSLAGCWSGQGPHGPETKVSYELVSGGTALAEYLQPSGSRNYNLTVYHLEGETPVASHFCAFGHLIRMRAEPSNDQNILHFRIFDGTNLSKERHEDHMTYVRFNFRDPDHLDIEWGLHHAGKEKPQQFLFTRMDCQVRTASAR